jgi:hypothetical protein
MAKIPSQRPEAAADQWSAMSTQKISFTPAPERKVIEAATTKQRIQAW